jgi:hypothetical protein
LNNTGGGVLKGDEGRKRGEELREEQLRGTPQRRDVVLNVHGVCYHTVDDGPFNESQLAQR